MKDETGSIVGIPDGVDDGRYRLTVEEVLPGATVDAPATVEVTVRPVDGGESTTALVPATRLAEPRAGLVYRARVAGGELEAATVDLGATVSRGASGVSSDEFAVPLQEVNAGTATLDGSRLLSLQRNHSVMALGEPGSGKTEFIKLLLPQIEREPDEPVVVFDYKGEYGEWAERHGDVIRLSTRDSTRCWNVFEEVEREAELEEISRLLFAESVEGAADENRYFPNAGRQVFCGVLKYLRRNFERNDNTPTNQVVARYFQQSGRETVHDDLEYYDDTAGGAVHLDPEADSQAAGVFANVQLVIEDVFTGDFAREGSFSIRDYLRNPDGRVLVLDYPIEEGERVEQTYRFFLEWAIKHALADPDRNAHFVLDEFAQIPHVKNVETLVATGRSRNTQAILGLQSVSQLEDKYGKTTARSILSGLTQEVFLRTGDPASVSYVTDRLGGERRVTAERDHAGDESASVSRPVLGRTIQELAPGEAVFATGDGLTHARVPMWSDLDVETRRALRADRSVPGRTDPEDPSLAPTADPRPSAQD